VKTPEEAAHLARVRAEEHDCRRDVFRGESTAWRASAGHRIRVEAYGPFDGGALLLTEVEHEAIFPALGSDEPSSYKNRSHPVGADLPFRRERRTPRPVIAGLVTATVQVGADGKPAAIAKLDGEGRYTVQFHFDSAFGSDRKASRPVRMAQPFGGTQHGMHFPLRPGTEVVVAFANGDPDRPVILGAVPNAHAPSPVTATNAWQNRIQTKSGALIEIAEKS
jgi:type VI secretion system secreted protein VgrG